MARPVRELSIKDSFLNELRLVPADMTHQVWEKINFLAQDPLPDGDLKKKLKSYRDIFRIRAGDYRIFYCFGGNWVRILSIRARRDKDVYEKPAGWESPPHLPKYPDDSFDDDESLAGGTAASSREWTSERPAAALPRILSPKWLTQLGIPGSFHPDLVSCKTEDDLLVSTVPEEYLTRIIDNLFPKSVAEIAVTQPDRLLFDTGDLIRFKEGDLLSFLLRLDAEQERLVDWSLGGPAMIRGGPGTGKSTVALYRTKALIQHARKSGKKIPRILFATYTPALVRFSRQLLEQLLREDISFVRVDTADNLAKSVLESFSGKELEPVDRTFLLAQLRTHIEHLDPETRKGIGRYRPDYLLDELEWVIDGRNLASVGEYLSCDRTGRGIPLQQQARVLVWNVLDGFRGMLRAKKITTSGSLRIDALETSLTNKQVLQFDSVIIDEAQDLTPTALSFLISLAVHPTGIYVTADAAQSIYFRGFSWQNVNDSLRFRGKTATLRRNYRTTREIAEAAAAFLASSGTEEIENTVPGSPLQGPLPVLSTYADATQEIATTTNFIRQMSRHLQLKPYSGAVLVPNEETGKQVAVQLTSAGLPARFMRGSQLDLTADEVKVMTFRTVKGLEFPFVVIAGLRSDLFPKLPADLDPDELDEELRAKKRSLFVALTRAMRGLLVLVPEKNPSCFAKDFRPEFWNTF